MNTDLLGHVIVDDSPHLLPGTEPCEVTMFKVASWYATGRHWKIWHENYSERKQAELAITRIARRHGHTHAVILEIRLPGEKRYIE